jgi:hypothetical protein
MRHRRRFFHCRQGKRRSSQGIFVITKAAGIISDVFESNRLCVDASDSGQIDKTQGGGGRFDEPSAGNIFFNTQGNLPSKLGICFGIMVRYIDSESLSEQFTDFNRKDANVN